MRIGLFGGTFDPVHIGHLRAALEIRELFNLNRIYFIPSAVPPHKSIDGIASPDARLEMIRRAVGNDPGLVVSDIEQMRSGVSYTIDTLAAFSAQDENVRQRFWILGMDAFLEIHTWKSFREILQQIPVIVMKRPFEKAFNPFDAQADIVTDYLATHLTGYRYVPEHSAFFHPDLHPVYLAAVTALDISSFAIRNLIRQGRSIRFLTPDAVWEYITRKGLYL